MSSPLEDNRGSDLLEDDAILRETSSFTNEIEISREKQNKSQSSPWEIVFMFFMCGIGTSISVSAVMSALVHYSFVFGEDFFVYVNLAVYAPLVPIALFQARWDADFDFQYGTRSAFAFRGIFSFLAIIIITSCLPRAATSLPRLCGLSALLGLASSILLGSMNQIASFTSSCGRNQAGFLFGYQTSGVIVLIISFTTGFGRSAANDGELLFYAIVTIIAGLSLAAFLILLCATKAAENAIGRRDSQLIRLRSHYSASSAGGGSPVTTPLLLEDVVPDETPHDGFNGAPRSQGEDGLLSYPELIRRTMACCLCIFISVSTNIAMTAWFAKVESSMMMLPQVLFFLRIFADALGRPASLLSHQTSIKTVSVIAGLRFCLVPIFFLAASTNWFPFHGNAPLLIVLVTVTAFLSGYITTTCYQIAPKQLLKNEAPSITKQASLLNIAFSISAFSGVTFSLILQKSGL
jgi:hypothetical protein